MSTSKPLRELYPTRKFDGKNYAFYISRAHKFEATRDKLACQSLGYKVRIVKLQGRWIVFRRK